MFVIYHTPGFKKKGFYEFKTSSALCISKNNVRSKETVDYTRVQTIVTTEIDDLSDMPYSHDCCSLQVYGFVCFCHTNTEVRIERTQNQTNATVAMVFLYMLLYLPRQHMASTSLL